MMEAAEFPMRVLKARVIPETPEPNALYVFPNGRMAATDRLGIAVPVAGATKTFECMAASCMLRCVHNLDGFPSVELVDTAGTVWGGVDVRYLDRNTLEVHVTHPMTFTVHLN